MAIQRAKTARVLFPVARTVVGMYKTRRLLALAAALLTAMVAIQPAMATAAPASTPAPYDGNLASYTVTVMDNCTGTVVNYGYAVVTASHCVAPEGKLRANLRVVSPQTSYYPSAVSYEPTWRQNPHLDVAVLWFPHAPIPLPAATVYPSKSPRSLQALGNQMMGANGVLLRRNGPAPGWRNAIGAQADPEYPRATRPHVFRLTSCTVPTSSVKYFTDTRIGIRCGMIHGASGGPVLETSTSSSVPNLFAVISAVYDRDLRNIVIPASRVDSLMRGRFGRTERPPLPPANAALR